MNMRHLICANGETVEFFLEQDGRRLTDPGVFRTLDPGSLIESFYPWALAEILRRAAGP